MWADGTLERFDERIVLGVDPQYANMVDPETSQVNRQRFSANATLEDLPAYLKATMETYQAYFIPQGYSESWRGYMPYAFYLEKGMKLFNLRTSSQYTIDDVVLDSAGKPTSEVLLSGATADADPPAISDVLIFDKDTGVKFSRATPRSTEGMDYESTATREDTPSAWLAHVDYSVLEEAPAVADPSAPDRRVLNRKPIYRETVETGDPHVLEEIYGQWLDARVRFDLWGATGDQAEKLVYWFLSYFRMNRWVLQHNGIKDIYFLRRGHDQPVGNWRSRLYHRAVDFIVRTEHLFVAHYRRLDQIKISVRLRQDRILEDAATPRTGRPHYTGLAPTIQYINE